MRRARRITCVVAAAALVLTGASTAIVTRSAGAVPAAPAPPQTRQTVSPAAGQQAARLRAQLTAYERQAAQLRVQIAATRAVIKRGHQ